MTRHTKASRRAAFRRHVSLPVRYTCRSTREAERFMEALKATPMPVLAPTSVPGAFAVRIKLGWVSPTP